MEAVRAKNPEQIAYIGPWSAGSDYNNRTMLKLTTLIHFYFDGPLKVGPEGGVNEADERLTYEPVRPPFTSIPWLAERGASVSGDQGGRLADQVHAFGGWSLSVFWAERSGLC